MQSVLVLANLPTPVNGKSAISIASVRMLTIVAATRLVVGIASCTVGLAAANDTIPTTGPNIMDENTHHVASADNHKKEAWG